MIDPNRIVIDSMRDPIHDIPVPVPVAVSRFFGLPKNDGADTILIGTATLCKKRYVLRSSMKKAQGIN